MNVFKPGDKVIYIGNRYKLQRDIIYTVNRINTSMKHLFAIKEDTLYESDWAGYDMYEFKKIKINKLPSWL